MHWRGRGRRLLLPILLLTPFVSILSLLLASLLAPLLSSLLLDGGGGGRSTGSRADARVVKGIFGGVFFFLLLAAAAALFCFSFILVLHIFFTFIIFIIIAIILLVVLIVIVVIIPARRRPHGPPLGVLLDHLLALDGDAGPGPARVDSRDLERVSPVEDEVGRQGRDLAREAPRGPGVASFLLRKKKKRGLELRLRSKERSTFFAWKRKKFF